MIIGEEMVGKSPAVKKVFNAALKVAATDSTVLIIGETGTGKELLANSIHRSSKRADSPFVAINCAAIPETLLESELFGYRKGAFTGANNDKKGLLEEANTGTLFLDEIADMSLQLQAKLLRVLDDGHVRRLGSNDYKKVNVRIIAATNKDLWKEIQAGRFRDDLFFRLNVVRLNIPPLRERIEDIPILIRHFIEKYNKDYNKDVIRISDDVLGILTHYDYPGNVRELENIIKHAIIFSDKGIITKNDLPGNIPSPALLSAGKENGGVKSLINTDEYITIAEMEKSLIMRTLEKSKNNHTLAAKKLGVSRSTLWRKMKEYAII